MSNELLDEIEMLFFVVIIPFQVGDVVCLGHNHNEIKPWKIRSFKWLISELYRQIIIYCTEILEWKYAEKKTRHGYGQKYALELLRIRHLKWLLNKDNVKVRGSAEDIDFDFCWYLGSYVFMRKALLCWIHQFLFFWCYTLSTGLHIPM